MNHSSRISGVGIKAFFYGLRADRFTGEVSLNCGECTKSVFMQSGEISHCRSTLLDDRLGDVIYRAGKISLDLFVDLAGKVNSETRFGDLLISQGVCDLVELWEALNLQSKEILQSLAFYPLLDCEINSDSAIKTPDYGLRFHWDSAIDEAIEEQALVKRFEKIARAHPQLTLDPKSLHLASTDFLRDIVSSIEEHKNFEVILDDHPPLSKNYVLRALFKLYSMSVITDSWDLFAQDLAGSAENELMAVVQHTNQIFRSIETVAYEHGVLGWDNAVTRANSILEQEFGQGVALVQEHGVQVSQLRKTIFLNTPFKKRARSELLRRWPISTVTLIQEGLKKALLYLLFEISNNKQLEDDARRIHADLVKSRGSYFSSVSEAIS